MPSIHLVIDLARLWLDFCQVCEWKKEEDIRPELLTYFLMIEAKKEGKLIQKLRLLLFFLIVHFIPFRRVYSYKKKHIQSSLTVVVIIIISQKARIFFKTNACLSLCFGFFRSSLHMAHVKTCRRCAVKPRFN